MQILTKKKHFFLLASLPMLLWIAIFQVKKKFLSKNYLVLELFLILSGLLTFLYI